MSDPIRRFALKLGAVVLLASAASGALAQAPGSGVAVPFYKPEDVLAGLYQHWAQPRAADFSRTAKNLHAASTAYCSAAPDNPDAVLASARAAWKAAVTDWERLSAVPFGPLIERRSVRAIDFTPTRPPLIERAIKQAPRGAAAMERVGTPAKGLPALEWLLWDKPLEKGSPACAYAIEVAADIMREADALQSAFANAGRADWSPEQNAAALTEFVNQWVGSVERLRWQEIERPVREAKSASRSAARFPRQSSGATSVSWANHWQALHDLAVFAEQEAPAPGRAVVPLELYLRARGRLALAEQWKESIAQGDSAMRGLAPGMQNRLLQTAKRLSSIKRMAEEEVAPALNVSIGFSDADGD